jgi:hypothetical protein
MAGSVPGEDWFVNSEEGILRTYYGDIRGIFRGIYAAKC